MLLSNLKSYLNPEFYSLISKKGFSELREPQEIAVNKGLFNGKNLVVASPTSSGKTFIAELAGINNILNMKGKLLYVAPLKALASEKYKDFKNKYEPLGLRIALSTGDMDSYESWIGKYDIIIVTAEKLDSMIRHGAPWLDDVFTVVIDEIHLLDDAERGPTLEVLITLLRILLRKFQIIALSATIKNAKELAEWLDAELVFSEYRPVALEKGVYYNSGVYLEESVVNFDNIVKDDVSNIVMNCLKENKQSLVFVSSRRSSESSAQKLAKSVAKKLSQNEKESLNELSRKFLRAMSPPTAQCRKNSECIQNGVAFHHAGLVSEQRELIEDNFRNGTIKTICATPTLAWGVNLPSQTVIVRDLKRFSGNGSLWIPVLEVHQMFGRAGRSDYNETGRALAVAKNSSEVKFIQDKYIYGETEDIYSKLSLEPVLRVHTLSLICGGFADDINSIMKFMEKTFYAKQYQDLGEIEEKISGIADMLVDFGFIEKSKGKLYATRLGERVSQLYLDPLTARHFINAVEGYDGHDDFAVLCALCFTKEMEPLFSIQKGDETEKEVLLYDKFLGNTPSEWDYSYYNFLRAFKTAKVLNEWINEKTEDEILEKYGISPGLLRFKIENADWLVYSMRELALITGKKNILNVLTKLRTRIKYGAKEELLTLLKLRNVGRQRARKLYNNEIKTISDVRTSDFEKLSLLLGEKLAHDLKNQVETSSGKYVF
ncbi:MAG: DEAD/DEAH box helicase [Candidatus Nanoarchaeia archaeon]|nr:DEAD/DEAH box helicase [Candidatus Nanoarchaeia archaeon]